MHLNASQQKAVSHVNGPLLVLAGPGSGKTRVITERTKYLIETQKISPDKILVVSFSRASAKEMKERFLKECNLNYTRVHFSTFHSLFFGILREFMDVKKEDVLTDSEKYSILIQWRKRYHKDNLGEHTMEIGSQDEEIRKCFDEIENYCYKRVPIEDYKPEFQEKREAVSMLMFYDRVKKYNHKIDFFDMELYCLELLESQTDVLKKLQERFHYFMVDEFQDINEIQFEILNLLVGQERNLVAVGDEDQSIYEFRGASPKIMLDFKKYYKNAECVNLEENYRSSFSILTLSQRVIKQNQMRYQKRIIGQKNQKDGGIHIHKVEDESHQSQWIIQHLKEKIKRGEELTNEAILFRTHACGSFLAGQLFEHGIPFSLKGYLPDLYDHFIGKDILAYFRVASTWQGGWSQKDFLRIVNKPLRYVSHSIFAQNKPTWENVMKYYYEDKKDWMCERMEEFRGDLKHLSFLSPYAGIMYLRTALGYEDYLEQLAGTDLDKLEQWKEILNEITQFARAYPSREEWSAGIEGYRNKLANPIAQEGGVLLMTIHGSKGLEFEQIYLIDAVEGIIPYKKSVDQGKIEEERRLFYVALTRAKIQVDIFVPKKRNSHNVGISRFVTEMKKN